MRYVMLLLLLLAQDAPVQVGRPPDGPYANLANHVCWRQPDQIYKGITYHQCPCTMSACDMGEVLETKNCLTYCGNKQCVCHADEACPAPELPELQDDPLTPR